MAFKLQTDIGRRIVKIFLPIKPKQIFLFGSHAKGNADQCSDFDLIIVYSTTKPFLDRLKELYTLWTMGKGVDILAYTPSEFEEMKKHNSFVQDVIKEGILLYEAKS
jgi:predicted nucleotidyltransferase